MGQDMPVQDMAKTYFEDGFVCPIDVLSADQAAELRAEFETAEAELSGDPDKLALLRAYPDRVLPGFDALTRNETLVATASSILGPDLMVWSGSLFIKERRTTNIVSWHQDLTYWGLDDAEETTLWVAISEASEESGCMRFVPGSHKTEIVPHNDTFDENNLLTRGQEVAVDVDEADAVVASLKAGQASMHHGHLFHASGPNTSDDRRIGMAIRYIKPSMKQQTGDKPLVSLVSGKDRYGHFTVAGQPKGRLHADDFALCAADRDLKKRLLY